MRIILLICLALIASCSTLSTDNETVFAYEYNEALVKEKPIKKVIVAPVNLGVPAPSHLRKAQLKVRAMVRDYLKDNGYEILPDYHFENAWQQASRTYGDIYDPTTGKIDANAWRAAMVITGERLREQTDADAIVFADLFEHNVQHSASFNHYARWYGVSRKPDLIGSGDSVQMDFNWSQPIKAASLMITIFNVELNRVFTSRGGIDTLEGVDTKRSTAIFIRKKKLLKNDRFIEEGIELAFHPFIVMKGYPAKTP